MSQPPSFISLDLEEQDVYEDLVTILESMMKMRMKSVKDSNFSDEEKDEYLHLTYRLASGLEAIADDAIIEDMQEVASSLEKNKKLLMYDPLQDEHWKQEEGKFAAALDDLVVAICRDDFHGFAVKHHILQAIKFIGVRGEPFKVRNETCQTITPFHGGIPLSKESLGKKIGGFFFGARYRVERVNPLTVKADGPLEFMDEFFREAKKKGYMNVQFPISQEDFEELSQEKKRMVSKFEPFQDSLGEKIFKYTKIASYPLLGLLPYSMQIKVNRAVPSYGLWNGYITSMILELAVGACLTGADWYLNDASLLDVGSWMVLADVALRGCGVVKNEEVVGSALLKGILYPLESGEVLVRDTLVEVPVNKPVSYEKVENPIPYFEALSSVVVPENIEKNLVLTHRNHNTFGKKFRAYIQKEAKEHKPEQMELKPSFFHDDNAVVYTHETLVEEYSRNCSLFCFPGERYVVTTISRDPVNYVEDALQILKKEGAIKEKVSTLTDVIGAKYIHFKRYAKGELTNELEGVN